jgi:hypothetical protein
MTRKGRVILDALPSPDRARKPDNKNGGSYPAVLKPIITE